MKMMKTIRFIIALLLILFLIPVAAGAHKTPVTLKGRMEWLHKKYNVNFVYDAGLPVTRPYTGPPIDKMPLRKALEMLFEGTEIDYKQSGNYVILRRRMMPPPHADPVKVDKPKLRHTLSGYVRDAAGESLINATVWDLTDGLGTMTNEYGFFSITLPEGNHRLRFSYLGFDDYEKNVPLRKDQHTVVQLKEDSKLPEVVVKGDMNSPLLNTQTGKRSLSQSDIKTEFSLLSSPDVVKTLQRTSGVAEGVELASGLYVHGGNNDENLFLIDGTPLYQINHTMGLFSSFNADVVKNVDFYKSGFPARYGGRLSSVVDVRTNDGDMQHFHGSYRLGLMDGSVQFEGPIQKGKTSFNVGLRRSWLDLITRPMFSIINHSDSEDNMSVSYYFHDLNAKVTHIFSDRSKIYLSLYSGNDALTSKDDYEESHSEGESYDVEHTKGNLSWGNFNMALNWNYQFSPKLFANFTAVYTHNRAKYNLSDKDSWTSGSSVEYTNIDHGYRSTIYDAGYRTEFDFRPNPHHHILFGQNYTWHLFKPQTIRQVDTSGTIEKQSADSIATASSGNTGNGEVESRNHHIAHEMNFYAEDEVTLNDYWSLNAGLNVDCFYITGKNFCNLDPRLALKYQVSRTISLKASYTTMTQYVHKISNSFLEMPTDYWVPTTKKLSPMRSYQLAAGVYMQPGRHWMLSLEGYYKASSHLLQYSNWVGLEPPAERWDNEVMEGRGRFYGLEADATYRTRHLLLTGSYTLSWNKRKYDDYFPIWYYDKFDNRHKLNLTARYEFNSKVTAFAAWSFHSGNHATVPTQYAMMPYMPNAYGQIISAALGTESADFVYTHPNNITLPAYHRLDVGFDFHHVTKHGHERIWNLSVYNLYCHLNTMYVKVDYNPEKQQFKARSRGYIPCIPSFSYTIKF